MTRSAGRSRLAGWLLLMMLAAPAVHSAEPAANVDATLAPIMAALRAVSHVEARYVERRTLRDLTAPLVIQGTLRFDAPDRLEKRGDPAADGHGEDLVADGNKVSLTRGVDTAPISFSMADHPEIGVLIDGIRAILGGDGAALQRAFLVQAAGTAANWQIVLQPRGRRDVLAWMRVNGQGGHVSEIDTADGDGDTSDMTITEKPTGSPP